MLASLIAGLSLGGSLPELTFDYVSFRGLQVKVGDIAVIEASGFQYYEPGWKKGYFSSAWKPITVFKNGDGSTTVISNSDDGRVANRQVFTPTANGFKVWAEFRWRGDKPAMLEYNIGRIWAPYVAQGSLTVDQRSVSRIDIPVSPGTDKEARILSSGREIIFNAPSSRITIRSEQAMNVLDARNYTIEWADGKELFWIGATNREIQPQGSIRFDYSIDIDPVELPTKDIETVQLPANVMTAAQGPDATVLPILPKPKQMQKSGGFAPIKGGLEFTFPEGLSGDVAWFNRNLESSWDWNESGSKYPVSITISPSITKLNGYQLTVRNDGATIIGQSLEGARYGLRTLAQLVSVRGGELGLQTATVNDWPSVQWRGVHLFVGPKALAFQSALSDRLLAPMKFNKVVLQCERTKWDSVPGIETAMTMSKDDLGKLANHYKSEGFEVIPLIQSMGHMEWFFANKKNLELAINPDVAYTLDPRKAESRAKINGIWREAMELMQPKIAHFGLDEIDNRGMDDKNLTNRIWDKGLPMLQSIAKEHKLTPMVWSDMMLASGEAADAFHAPSKEIASHRRKMLTPGTYVADWHYLNDPNPEKFDQSLKLWNAAGMKPIATTWFRPKNIRGFTLSAINNNAGVLQSTWAGYESNEANFVREFEQFAAMVLMADYAWSGRTEMPDKVGYDPGAVLQKLYFGGKQPVTTRDGQTLGDGVETNQIGTFGFRPFAIKQLFGVTHSVSFNAPHHLSLPISGSAKDVVLAMDCLSTINEVALAGNVVLNFADGTSQTTEIRYGMHVRSVTDKRSTIATPRKGTLSAIRITAPGKELKSIDVIASHSAAGLRLHGVTILK